MMPKKLLKSKKGGIPAINEIVLTILNITPKPILYLIFILLLTTIATFVVPLFLNLFGYSCVYENGELELYQVPMKSIAVKSIQDVKEGLGDLLGLPTYELPEDPFPQGNKSFIRIPDGCFETINNHTQLLYGYTALCTDCPAIGNIPVGSIVWNLSVNWRTTQSICTGDGDYQRNLWNADIYGANFCYRCSPPSGYYYNHSNIQNHGWVFTIANESYVEFIDETYYHNVHLNRIKNLGGVKREQNTEDFVSLQCREFNQPSIYFFNIELFNRTMWIILLLGSFLITFAYAYYGAVGLN